MELAETVAADCENCATEYERQPGLTGALTMIDLYRAIARLARIVEAQQRTIDSLRQSA